MSDQRNWRAILEDAVSRDLTQAEVAVEQRVRPSFVHKKRKQLGVTLRIGRRGRAGLGLDWASVLAKAKLDDWDIGKVARANRVSKAAVSKYTRVHGVVLRNQFEHSPQKEAAA